MYSRKTSVLLLNIVELFERFSYYGIRALIVLYVTAPDGFAMSNESAIDYVSTFTMALALVAVPFGLLSDLVLKQKNAVIIGGSFALLGSLLLLSHQAAIIGLGIIMLLIGTGLVKNNLLVLLGRLFRKEDQKRDLAFILRIIAINFGSFLGIMTIGYIGEVMGYAYGFGIAALAIFIYLALFLIIRNKLDLQEETLPFTPLADPLLLDQEQRVTPRRNSFYTILLIIFLSFLFFEISGTLSSFFRDSFNQIDRFFFNQQESSIWFVETFYFVSGIIMALALLFIWRKKSTLSSWQRFTLAFFGVLLVSLILIGSDYLTDIPLQVSIIGAGILIAGVEVAMSAVSLSYITRLSEPKYASTTIGAFFLFSYLWTEGVTYLENNFSVEVSLTHCFYLALIIGLVLVLFRKEWSTLSGGLR